MTTLAQNLSKFPNVVYNPTKVYAFTLSKRIGCLRRKFGYKLGLLDVREEWLDKECNFLILSPKVKKALGVWGVFMGLIAKLEINPLYFAKSLKLHELPRISRTFLMPLPQQAEEIAIKNGCNLKYIHFERSGYNTFRMYEGDKYLGYCLFIAENEID